MSGEEPEKVWRSKITLVVTLDDRPYPMLYTVDAPPLLPHVTTLEDHTLALKDLVTAEIHKDTGESTAREQIELQFAFAGDVTPIADWRDQNHE